MWTLMIHQCHGMMHLYGPKLIDPTLGFHKFRLHMHAIVGCSSGHCDGSDLGMAFLVSTAMELLQHLLATVLRGVAASTTDEEP